MDFTRAAPKPPTYDGTRNAVVLRRWIERIDAYATLLGVNNDVQKIQLAALYLAGDALDYWQFHKRKSDLPGGTPIVHWGPTLPTVAEPNPPARVNFIDTLTSEFSPRNWESYLREYFYDLKQGDLSVAEYTNEFHRCLVHLPPMTDSDLIHLYIRGLNGYIAIDVRLRTPETLKQAESFALWVWDVHHHDGHKGAASSNKKAWKRDQHRPFAQSHLNSHDDGGVRPMDLSNVNTRLGHRQSANSINTRLGPPANHQKTKLSAEERRRRQQSGACFNCGRTGHSYRNCPTRTGNANTIRRDTHPLPPRPSRQNLRVNSVATNTLATSTQ
jgi:Ty3 transposon capsid-like protein